MTILGFLPDVSVTFLPDCLSSPRFSFPSLFSSFLPSDCFPGDFFSSSVFSSDRFSEDSSAPFFPASSDCESDPVKKLLSFLKPNVRRVYRQILNIFTGDKFIVPPNNLVKLDPSFFNVDSSSSSGSSVTVFSAT